MILSDVILLYDETCPLTLIDRASPLLVVVCPRPLKEEVLLLVVTVWRREARDPLVPAGALVWNRALVRKHRRCRRRLGPPTVVECEVVGS